MGGREDRESHWLGHIQSWQGSGLTRLEYCQSHGLMRKSFDYWVRRSREAARDAAASPMTLVAARPAAVAPKLGVVSLTVKSAEGWQLSFEALPPARWLRALLTETGTP